MRNSFTTNVSKILVVGSLYPGDLMKKRPILKVSKTFIWHVLVLLTATRYLTAPSIGLFVD